VSGVRQRKKGHSQRIRTMARERTRQVVGAGERKLREREVLAPLQIYEVQRKRLSRLPHRH